MRVNKMGFDLTAGWEGCVLFTYDDAIYPSLPHEAGAPVQGTLTIGYGHTGPEVCSGLEWDQEQADRQLMADIHRTAEAIRPLFEMGVNDNQFSALNDLAFNIGVSAFASSTALARVNSGDWAGVPDAIRMWNKTTINGVKQISPGLVNRREAECDLWAMPVAPPAGLRVAAVRPDDEAV